jgi:uncharacterized protein (DUF1697 family)
MNSRIWIVLFRGVGGKTQLPVKPLREALSEAGFEKVATYINSGNAIVASDMPRERIVAAIAKICAEKFHFEKDVHVLSLAEWEKLVQSNPFPDAVAVPKFLHAAVLADAPDPAKVKALRSHASDGERIGIVGKTAYIHTPNGFGKSKLAEKFDKGIGVPNTARNWNTVLKLAEMARAAVRS